MQGKRTFVCKGNYVYACVVKPSDILTIKNVLLRTVYT